MDEDKNIITCPNHTVKSGHQNGSDKRTKLSTTEMSPNIPTIIMYNINILDALPDRDLCLSISINDIWLPEDIGNFTSGY